MTQHKPKRDIYQEVTDSMIAMIEAGAGRWEKPWITAGALPVNAKTGQLYRGINVPLLWRAAERGAYGSNYWASFKQWQAKGAKVRKGERATLVTFWKLLRDDNGQPLERANGSKVFFLRHYNVFNADQVDGWEAPAVELPNEAARIAEADRFIQATRAKIRLNGGRAYYSPAGDYIGMPGFERFKATATASATDRAYGVLLHELTHWTGHESRCARDFAGRFGDQAYAFEELVAELGSAFLCAGLGISQAPREDHAQYLQSWLKVLRNDKKAIFTAASKAQQACDFLQELQDGAPAPKGPDKPAAPAPQPVATPAPLPAPLVDQPAGNCVVGGRKVAMPWPWSDDYKKWVRGQEQALNAPDIPDKTKRQERRARLYAEWLAWRDGRALPKDAGIHFDWDGDFIRAVVFEQYDHKARIAIPNHDWRPALEFVNDQRQAA